MTGPASRVMSRLGRGRTGESGAVALIVALLMPVFIGFAAISVDIARVYVEGERAQKVADAASLAGVVYMPQDFPKAKSVALDTAAKNGYAPSGTVTITVEPGPRPSQLKVTVSSVIRNAFAAAIGFPTSTISRVSISDYNGPAPMGSPCSTFGNEPPGSPGAGPTTVLPGVPVNPFCTTAPQFWANIQGPNTDKIQGDRYMNRRCTGSSVDGCTGTRNDDFNPLGYFFVVRVLDPGRTGPVTVQLYDPAWINTGTSCGDLPSIPTNNMNPYATTDAQTRYDNTNNIFCPGDYPPGASGRGTRVDTSFALRAPTPTGNPVDGAPIAGCTKQFKGSTAAPTVGQLRSTNPSYVPQLAQIFHQWVPLCTINNPVAGDYYLQVRTNVALPGGMAANQFIATGNSNVTGQSGDDTSMNGWGSNQFAIRAQSLDGSALSVAGYERMPIDINASNPRGFNTTFNLIRVLPGAAGKYIKFGFFDAADGSTGGTVQVQRPTDATGSITATASLQGCQGAGVQSGNLPACTANVSPALNNGKLQTISVPIPSDYNCNYNAPGGCWFRVVITYSQATDITTWSATVEGDPVRIVK